MGLRITEDRMSGDESPHTATRRGDKWEVSWLPGRKLTRDEAVTAMHLAWAVALNASVTGPNWPFIVTWAGELGLSGHEAVAMCTEGKGKQQ